MKKTILQILLTVLVSAGTLFGLIESGYPIKRIRAKQVELLDESGKVIINMSCGDRSNGQIVCYRGGQPEVKLGETLNGGSALTIYRDGDMKVALGSSAEREGAVSLLRNGHKKVCLSVSGDQGGSVDIHNGEKRIATLCADANGAGRVCTFNKDGQQKTYCGSDATGRTVMAVTSGDKTLASMAADGSDAGRLSTYKDGKLATSAGVGTSGEPFVATMSDAGPLVSLGVDDFGSGTLTTYNSGRPHVALKSTPGGRGCVTTFCDGKMAVYLGTTMAGGGGIKIYNSTEQESLLMGSMDKAPGFVTSVLNGINMVHIGGGENSGVIDVYSGGKKILLLSSDTEGGSGIITVSNQNGNKIMYLGTSTYDDGVLKVFNKDGDSLVELSSKGSKNQNMSIGTIKTFVTQEANGAKDNKVATYISASDNAAGSVFTYYNGKILTAMASGSRDRSMGLLEVYADGKSIGMLGGSEGVISKRKAGLLTLKQDNGNCAAQLGCQHEFGFLMLNDMHYKNPERMFLMTGDVSKREGAVFQMHHRGQYALSLKTGTGGASALSFEDRNGVHSRIEKGADGSSSMHMRNSKGEIIKLDIEHINAINNEQADSAHSAFSTKQTASWINQCNAYKKPYAISADDIPKIKEVFPDCITMTELAHLRNIPNIEMLGFPGAGLTDEMAPSVCMNMSVKWLVLSRNHVTDIWGKHLINMPNLTNLSIDDTAMTGAVFNDLKQLKKLTHLNVRNVRISIDEAKTLLDFPTLEVLWFGEGQIPNELLEELKHKNPKIQLFPMANLPENTILDPVSWQVR